MIDENKLIEDLTNQKYSFDINAPKSHEKTIREMASKQYESVLKCINNQPQVQPIANDKTKLKEKLIEYFNIGDSSAYYLTRVKEAFSVGTMTLDDFVEFTESDIDDLVDYLTKKEV